VATPLAPHTLSEGVFHLRCLAIAFGGSSPLSLYHWVRPANGQPSRFHYCRILMGLNLELCICYEYNVPQ
jgi:hypothetical protein